VWRRTTSPIWTGIVDVGTVRHSPIVLVPNEAMAEKKAELESFLYDRVYRHRDVLRMRSGAQDVLRRLFDRFVAKPDLMPASYRARIEQVGRQRCAGDYLAGMTDRFVERERERVLSVRL